jgi:hypothetical protein
VIIGKWSVVSNQLSMSSDEWGTLAGSPPAFELQASSPLARKQFEITQGIWILSSIITDHLPLITGH